ncbi:MAG: hypothetical protein IKQ27_10165, partial [Lachnospiraceae bacterium]|nr:hypothetical protein [Lachnospiraceae bacterium]
TYRRTGDGDEAVVRCVTGTMAMKGRHFSIEKMSAANELKVRTSHDNLFTGLFGNSGDIVVKLDQGMVSVQDFETKEFNDERTGIPIWRRRSEPLKGHLTLSAGLMRMSAR